MSYNWANYRGGEVPGGADNIIAMYDQLVTQLEELNRGAIGTPLKVIEFIQTSMTPLFEPVNPPSASATMTTSAHSLQSSSDSSAAASSAASSFSASDSSSAASSMPIAADAISSHSAADVSISLSSDAESTDSSAASAKINAAAPSASSSPSHSASTIATAPLPQALTDEEKLLQAIDTKLDMEYRGGESRYQLFDRIHKEMTNEQIAEKLVQKNLHKNAWSVLYSLKWEEMESPTMQGNSANSIYSIVDVKDKNNKDTKIFVKLADINTGDDNIILDNINGRILRYIHDINEDKGHMVVQSSTMEYAYSFLAEIMYNSEKLQEHEFYGKWEMDNIYMWPLNYITQFKNEGYCPFNPNFTVLRGAEDFDEYPDTKTFMASVFSTIRGPSISHILSSNDETKVMNDLIPLLPKFFQAFRYLGMKYGMMHNDLHAGNVLLDEDTDTLKLIDYGRMTFPLDVVDESAIRKIETDENARYLILDKNKIYKYTNLSAKWNQTVKFSDKDLYAGHIFDFITITLGIHKYMSIYIASKDWMNMFEDICGIHIDRRITEKGDMWITCAESKTLYKKFQSTKNKINTAALDLNQKDGLVCIAEGLYFFALMCEFLITNQKNYPPRGSRAARSILTTVPKAGYKQFQLRDFVTYNGYMHWYFQFYNRISTTTNTWLFDDIVAYIFKNSTDDALAEIPILNALNKGTIDIPQLGGGHRKKHIKKVRTSNTDILKAFVHDRQYQVPPPLSPRHVALKARQRKLHEN